MTQTEIRSFFELKNLRFVSWQPEFKSLREQISRIPIVKSRANEHNHLAIIPIDVFTDPLRKSKVTGAKPMTYHAAKSVVTGKYLLKNDCNSLRVYIIFRTTNILTGGIVFDELISECNV